MSICIAGKDVFSEDYVKSLYRKHKQTASIALVISSFENRKDAALLQGRGVTERGYAGWKEMSEHWTTGEKKSLRMLELMSIGPNAIIRRVNNGAVTKTVLAGKDPTILDVNGCRGDILHVGFHRLPVSQSGSSPGPVIIGINVKTDIFPAKGQALAITYYLYKVFRHREIQVSIRSDSWFLDDPFFPAWFPFGDNFGPRNLTEFRSHREMLCWGDSRGVKCGGVL